MPHFVLIEGGLGHGKTTIASFLAHYWSLKSGGEVKLFSNFDLAGSTSFDKAERWLEVADARGSVVVWDEAQTQFDRRTWTRNVMTTQIFNMTRKLRSVHIFTNPVGANLDGRILDLVEVFIHVQKFQGSAIQLDVYEYQDKRFGPWGRHMKRARLPWNRVKQIFALNLFDTDQMLYPFPVPKTEREQMALLEKIVEHQEAAVKREKTIETKPDMDGWILPSDHYFERYQEGDDEIEDEESGEFGLPLSVDSDRDNLSTVATLSRGGT